MPDLKTYISDYLCGRADRAPGQPYKKACIAHYKNDPEGVAEAKAKYAAFIQSASKSVANQ